MGPDSLFKLVIKFIAKNIGAVESLCDFPDEIGHQIFKEASKCNIFNPISNYALKATELFSEAYGEQLLSEWNLTGCHLFIGKYLEHVIVFKNLVVLDLSSCYLDDEHELLSHIGHLLRLEKLNLKNNILSDKGLFNITAPWRLFKRGPGNLQVIFLQGNTKISNKSCSYLSKFTELVTIDLSGTNVNKAGIDILKKELKMVSVPKSAILNEEFCSTVGWALDVVNEWTRIQERKPERKELSKAKLFYSGKRIALPSDNAKKTTNEQMNTCIILTKRKDTHQKENLDVTKAKASTKRSLDSGNDSFEDKEDDLIENYVKFGSKRTKVSLPTSLSDFSSW